MLADVPLGAFLSRGVDSSTIVALMQAQSNRPVRTFTIGFDESGYDEATHAKAVANHLGTEHTELYVRPEDALQVIPKLPAIYCEPFSDSSQIPTFLVSQLARQHVTVALSGDGGDELFGGYNRYLSARKVWGRMQRLPSGARHAAARLLHTLSPATGDRLLSWPSRCCPGVFTLRPPVTRRTNWLTYSHCRDGHAFFHQLTSHWKDPASVVIGAHEAQNTPDRSQRLAEDRLFRALDDGDGRADLYGGRHPGQGGSGRHGKQP